MKTVIGLFKDYGSAEHTLGEFAAMGLDPQQIGMLSRTGLGDLQPSTAVSVLDLPEIGQVCANGAMLRLLDAIHLQSSRGSMQGALEKIGLGRDEVRDPQEVAARERGLERGGHDQRSFAAVTAAATSPRRSRAGGASNVPART